MNKAAQERYKIDIAGLFTRANIATKQNFSTLLRSMFMLIFVVIAFFVGFFNIYNIETLADLEAIPTETYVLNMLIIAVMAPLKAGMSMMAVKTERKQPIVVLNLFDYLPYILMLATAELIISLLIQVGMSLFILPAVYVYITTTFAQTLIADKKVSPFSALKLSIVMSNQYLLSLLTLYAIFFALFLLGMITFGLALIWVVPLYYNVTGILYNDLFGYQDKPQASHSIGNTEETHFDA